MTVLILMSCAGPAAAEIIRVMLSDTPGQITLRGGFSILENSKSVLAARDKSVKISLDRNKIHVDGRAFSGDVYFKNEGSGLISIGKYQYKGDLAVCLRDKLYYINYLDAEEYVKGVLPNEISAKWPLEVIKAQAVAARTFAYYSVLKITNSFYDLTDNTFSQVYKGIINENQAFNQAIEATKGEVLTYRDELIQAMFHSCCGGHTESAGDVWNENLAYLKGIPCGFCRDAPYYTWEADYTSMDIENRLKGSYPLDGLSYIRPGERTRSGRWKSVRVSDRKNNYTIQANQFRILLDIRKLRSTKFTIQKTGSRWIIKGRGWGHGVGMCQWGAKKMAEQHRKYSHILSYYYRGCRIKSIETVKKDHFK